MSASGFVNSTSSPRLFSHLGGLLLPTLNLPHRQGRWAVPPNLTLITVLKGGVVIEIT